MLEYELFELTASADHSVELDALRARMGAILDAIADGVITVDLRGRVDVANPAACALLGASESALRGQDADRALGRHLDGQHPAISELAAAGTRHDGQETLVRADGSTIPAEFTVSALQVAGVVVGAVVVFRDISERLAAHAHLEWLATHDRVTGLLNRAGLDARLRAALSGARAGDGAVTLLFCDLDGFKAVNDTHGHEAGDVVLRAVAERLTGCVRDGDLVARFAGDEFVILLTGQAGAASARVVVDRAERSVAAPVHVSEQVTVSVGVSVGVAHARHGDDADRLLRDADAAMYARKRARKRGR